MKIINELAKVDTKKNGNSLAIRLTILIAVIMLGIVLFIYSELELSLWKYHRDIFGDYHAQLYGITAGEYENLLENTDIVTLAPAKAVYFTDLPFKRGNVDLYFQAPELLDTDFFALVRSLKGHLPKKADEILVSDVFVLENPAYGLGSILHLEEKEFIIAGIYKEHLYSFNKNYNFYAQLSSTDPAKLFHGPGFVDTTIWFKNERDTYTLMRQILAELGREDENTSLKIGALHYNTPYLEGKLIFRSGLIPSADFIERWSLRIGFLLFLTPLFIIMIYNAFNVWSNRDLRQIGLLKSSGMTPRQIRSLFRRKALRLSLAPILSGLLLAYGCTNLLFYLMWLNEKSALVSYSSPLSQLKWVTPNPLVFIILFFLALFCVYTAILKPARRSSRLSVVEAMKGQQVQPQKVNRQPRNYSKNTVRNLGKNNHISYRHVFRGLALAMALAGMAFSAMLIIHSQRSLEDKYDTPGLPYNLYGVFYTTQKAPPALFSDLKEISGLHEYHCFTSYSFPFLPTENPDFISEEFNTAFRNNRRKYPGSVTLYGLEDSDYQTLLIKNGYNLKRDNGFLLLNLTTENPQKAYQHRTYIPLAKEYLTNLTVIDDKDQKKYNLPIAGEITEFPFGLNPLWSHEIALFTSLSKLEDFLLENDKIDENSSLKYTIRMAADPEFLEKATEAFLTTLHRHIPPSDTFIRNYFLDLSEQKEQYRNELLLTISIQLLLVLIGFSNAYNSVHMNLKARTRDFALLRSVGMTEDQLKKMLGYEMFFLGRRILFYYIVMLAIGVWGLAAKKHFMFSPWQLALHLNYPLLFVFFAISLLGIWAAMESGRCKILKQTIISGIRQ